jgi:hypothetical protein
MGLGNGLTALQAACNVAASDTFPKRIPKATKNERITIRSVVKSDTFCLPNTTSPALAPRPTVPTGAGEAAPGVAQPDNGLATMGRGSGFDLATTDIPAVYADTLR